jgi:hypothetical protein
MSEARLIMGGAAPRQGRDVIGIIDPHRHHLADAAPKGSALAPARQRSPRPTRSTAPCGPYHRRGSYEPLDLDRSRALRTRSRPPLTGFRASLASSPMEMPTAPQGRRIRESVVCSPGTGFAELADHDELADWTRPASSSRSATVRLAPVRPCQFPRGWVTPRWWRPRANTRRPLQSGYGRATRSELHCDPWHHLWYETVDTENLALGADGRDAKHALPRAGKGRAMPRTR